MSWKCKNCETENSDSQSRCEVCGQEKGNFPPPPVFDGNSGNGTVIKPMAALLVIIGCLLLGILLCIYTGTTVILNISHSSTQPEVIVVQATATTHVRATHRIVNPTKTPKPSTNITWPSHTPNPTRTTKPSSTPRNSPSIYPVATVDPDIWKSIHAPYQSRLDIGDKAYVSTAGNISSLTVYERPYLDSVKIGKIYPGNEMWIVKGPSSSDNMVWWRIETTDHSIVGWVSEGSKNTYWLIPVGKTNLDAWAACHVSYQSRLDIGSDAYVADYPDIPNRVRKRPYSNAPIIGKIYPGEKIEILDGPSCSSNMIWWKVKSLETGLIGWTSEGDTNNYWLVPAP